MQQAVTSSQSLYELPELDALRAFAIMIVLLFHLDVAGFGTGYLGVDLFFTLSGYLMVFTMLRDQERHGRFRVGAFFARRVRRILPPLVITAVATLAVSFLLFSPQALKDISDQALNTLLLASNFFFMNQAGYFAPENELRPFLHSWSLSVEEQFYIVFGLILFVSRWISFRAVLSVAALLALGMLGLGLALARGVPLPVPSEYLFASPQRAMDVLFYNSIYRAPHFLLGGVMPLYGLHRMAPLRGVPALLALVLPPAVLVAISGLGASWLLSPVAALLAPVMLLRNEVSARLGRIALIAFIAALSYQLYLVHWPVIVFWRQVTFAELTWPTQLLLGAISVVLALGLRRLADPVAARLFAPALRERAAGWAGLAAPWALGLVVAVYGNWSDGAPWRIPQERLMQLSADEWRAAESRYCAGTNFLDGRELGWTAGDPVFTCRRARPGGPRIVVWGDSHARHLLPGLSEVFPEADIYIAYFTSCSPFSGFSGYLNVFNGRTAHAEICAQRNRALLEELAVMGPVTVILHHYAYEPGNHPQEWHDAVRHVLSRLEELGDEVLWFGPVIKPDRLLIECRRVPGVIPDSLLKKRCRGDAEMAATLIAENAELARLYAPTFVDVAPAFCPDGRIESCTAGDARTPLFRDKHHLTVPGSVALVSRFRDRVAPMLDRTREASLRVGVGPSEAPMGPAPSRVVDPVPLPR
ncbi:Peptidoglycan/LPS O-acetylase OafA/YrhL, contains acyltransferase and SGNH-hydrolase domains [Meinhardsimonia xiamenensis]|uniref:Peptidoglycan/LPS O-acetylase OafA/YrhL, contains acyltransferase and SGNH-hydrolase domains n=1 Tax=Meinhardsimonia xiamenensis TaxID=990712 RepID=A0A1G9HKE8_9RHOB|nr:acyltransferase family protein [Meinhardsimonia xiamenensis]PRX27672.1 peptidoglycan/LPS O-acetylase OafA/YrhL [Meinhardsimonia xiamenensis]SDL13236.1 Peptidoglycan/LPS O-acetylase OafA/YrhL, contains acyltransferase and SGNH-hydrolase domains [Meinhardsimonia xiamenensis]